MRNIFLSLWVVFALSAYASAQTPYYQVKTIRFVVGYPSGSTHDLWARVVGPYMTKYIPGNPQTICSEHAGCGVGRDRQLRLQRCKAGWAQYRRYERRDLYRSAVGS